MSLMISHGLAAAALKGITASFEGDEGVSPQLSLWGGVAPASMDEDVTEDHKLLVEFDLIGPVFGEPQLDEDLFVYSDMLPVGGQLGRDDGEATFFRLYDRDGEPVMQGTIGLPGSGADIEMDDIDVTTTKLISVQGARLTLPLI